MSNETLRARWTRMARTGTALAAAAAALCVFAQCRLSPEPEVAPETYVTVRLNDSLSRFDSVVVQILERGDTAAIVGTMWSQRLDSPGAIPSYRLEPGATQDLTVRVRAWDAEGRLALDERIAKVDGKQTVTAIPIPKPSPRLASAWQQPRRASRPPTPSPCRSRYPRPPPWSSTTS